MLSKYLKFSGRSTLYFGPLTKTTAVLYVLHRLGWKVWFWAEPRSAVPCLVQLMFTVFTQKLQLPSCIALSSVKPVTTDTWACFVVPNFCSFFPQKYAIWMHGSLVELWSRVCMFLCHTWTCLSCWNTEPKRLSFTSLYLCISVCANCGRSSEEGHGSHTREQQVTLRHEV